MYKAYSSFLCTKLFTMVGKCKFASDKRASEEGWSIFIFVKTEFGKEVLCALFEIFIKVN